MAAPPRTVNTDLRIAPLQTHVGLPFDPVVLFVAGALMTLGVVMVYSASVTIAGAELDWRQWWKTPLRQSVFALLGFLVMLVAAHCDYRWLAWTRRCSWRSSSWAARPSERSAPS
jgi:cell division protein FtsW (lipid II flippase)